MCQRFTQDDKPTACTMLVAAALDWSTALKTLNSLYPDFGLRTTTERRAQNATTTRVAVMTLR